MPNINNLPGFDAWLTNQPEPIGVEPRQYHLDEAAQSLKAEGIESPTVEQIYNLACMLAEQEVQDSIDDAEEHAAESRRDDMENDRRFDP